MRLDIDTPIRFPDGQQFGTIQKVVVDPRTATVLQVVVETRGLGARTALVPVDLLQDAPGEVLAINATRDQADALPDYVTADYADVPPTWAENPNYLPGDILFPATMFTPIVPVHEESNAPPGSVALSEGTEVDCTDGRLGVIDEVLTDANDRVESLVVRPDAEDQPLWLVPSDLIANVDDLVVQLACTLAELPQRADPFQDPDAEPSPEPLIPSS